MAHSVNPRYAPPPRNPLPTEALQRLNKRRADVLRSVDAYGEEFPKDTRLAKWAVEGERLMVDVNDENLEAVNQAWFLGMRLLKYGKDRQVQEVVNFLKAVQKEVKEFLSA